MIDRAFCWLLGHTIEETAPLGKGVWRCPHCTGRITSIELAVVPPTKRTRLRYR